MTRVNGSHQSSFWKLRSLVYGSLCIMHSKFVYYALKAAQMKTHLVVLEIAKIERIFYLHA
jgi:hypothetical protein